MRRREQRTPGGLAECSWPPAFPPFVLSGGKRVRLAVRCPAAQALRLSKRAQPPDATRPAHPPRARAASPPALAVWPLCCHEPTAAVIAGVGAQSVIHKCRVIMKNTSSTEQTRTKTPSSSIGTLLPCAPAMPPGIGTVPSARSGTGRRPRTSRCCRRRTAAASAQRPRAAPQRLGKMIPEKVPPSLPLSPRPTRRIVCALAATIEATTWGHRTITEKRTRFRNPSN